MARTPEQIVAQEVLCCMSYIVVTLAKHDGQSLDLERDDDLAQMCEQAFELARPIDDWEEAAIQAGWSHGPQLDWSRESSGGPLAPRDFRKTAQEACELDNIEPYQRDVFEHWAVTDWFANQLEARGEKVDKDFGGLCIWARTTTGQAIYADGVIEAIAADLAKAG